MKEMTLRELQLFSLDILKDVHSFCVSNDISYSLAYGTLIGAIRHKGFIPWDDDIDIIMPRPDYERFCRDYKSESYKLADRHNSYIEFARIYDDVKTICNTVFPWKKGTSGVWIDIFPIDAVSDIPEEFEKHYYHAEKMLEKQRKIRSSLLGFKPLFRSLSLARFPISSIKLTIKKIIYSRVDIIAHNERYNRLIQTYNWGTTKHWAQLACADNGPKDFGENSWFKSFIFVDFEDTRLYAMEGYNEWLEKKYGDYMQLPPETEREQHTMSITRFYWK